MVYTPGPYGQPLLGTTVKLEDFIREHVREHVIADALEGELTDYDWSSSDCDFDADCPALHSGATTNSGNYTHSGAGIHSGTHSDPLDGKNHSHYLAKHRANCKKGNENMTKNKLILLTVR